MNLGWSREFGECFESGKLVKHANDSFFFNRKFSNFPDFYVKVIGLSIHLKSAFDSGERTPFLRETRDKKILHGRNQLLQTNYIKGTHKRWK